MTITDSNAIDDRGWAARGACTELDPERFFVKGADQQKVKPLCLGCPVRAQCLADALDNRIEFGMWGGMTERERRRLLRQHPEVRDWRAVLEHSRELATAARA